MKFKLRATLRVALAAALAVSGDVQVGAGGSYDLYFQDVQQQTQGGPVRTYGFRAWPNYDVTLLDTHTVVGAVPTVSESWTVDGQTISVTLRAGRVREATTATLASIIQSVAPGDTILCRSGTYTGKYDSNGWSGQLCLNAAESGTASQRIHITSYPGEVAHFSSTEVQFYPGRFSTAADCAHFWDASALQLTCTATTNGANLYGGEQTANSSSPESGAHDWRFVGNLCHITNTGANNVGQIEVGGDNWFIAGNRLTNNTARTFDNQAHSIYVDSGADNVEICFNRFEQRREGFAVMFHQDGTPMTYSNGWVHHNLFENYTADASSRCSISMSNVSSASSVVVEDNWFKGCGAGPYNSDNFGPAICYSGTMTLRRNIFDAPREKVQVDAYPGGNGQTRNLIVGSGANRNWWGPAYGAGSVQVAAATDDGPSPYVDWVMVNAATFTVEA